MIRSLKNYFHLFISLLANAYYRYPSKKMTVIGVTGTDGKTTTSSMIAHILKAQGFKVALITTVGAQINGKFYETGFHTTTPSSFFLQKYLSLAKEEGCTHAVIEITSHALDQHRARGVNFNIGVVTNITQEHLDYHKTFERYVKAKSKLLKQANFKLLNYDDKSYNTLKQYVPEKNRFFYSLENKDSYIKPSVLPSEIKSLGEFNMQNALAAAAVCSMLKISLTLIKQSLLTFTLPEGRLEVVHTDNFQVIVDFAHTPNAFLNVLPTIKKMAKGKLIHVFGAAGKRDKSKRFSMGKASSSMSDVIVLTAEDPRGENIEEICNQIAEGFSGFKRIYPNLITQKDKYFVVIPERKKAIEYALSQAKKGDIVAITGKGHEKTMNISGQEEPWSDKEVVFETLQRLSSKK